MWSIDKTIVGISYPAKNGDFRDFWDSAKIINRDPQDFGIWVIGSGNFWIIDLESNF